MQRKSYIIRFIDLGLIILFSFLMISDVSVISQIQLPGSESDTPPAPTDAVARLVGIFIEESGVYQVRELATGELLFVNVEAIGDLEYAIKTLRDVQQAIGSTLEVVIEPHPNAVMQRLVDVHDMCERLDVGKNINMAMGRGSV